MQQTKTINLEHKQNSKTQQKKPKFQDTKNKKPMQKHDRWAKDGQEKEQDTNTHNIRWIEDRRQQQTKLKPCRKF